MALWYCLLRGGLSADIAGVLIALCIPMRSAQGADLVGHLIKRWSVACGLLILPIFALANCAVPLSGAATVSSTAAGPLAQLAVPAGVSLGLIVGKPLGIFGFSYLAIKLGLASMPPGMTKRDLAIVGVLGSIGFTMCLFLIENALAGSSAQMAKLAVFLASTTGALTGAALMASQPRRLEPAAALAASAA
uniref:Na(+)/H(+) antiporter NhaA n=1 Tax=Pyrodinium bahamense TaxID=73915 RepID=A0A7S0FVC1_9DINO